MRAGSGSAHRFDALDVVVGQGRDAIAALEAFCVEPIRVATHPVGELRVGDAAFAVDVGEPVRVALRAAPDPRGDGHASSPPFSCRSSPG